MTNLHSMEMYNRADGKVAWRVSVGGDIVATDAGQGYENEKDALAGLFGLWFGTWDESFLALYQKWQAYADTAQYDIPPEAQEGAPVHIQRKADAPDPEKHMEQLLREKAAGEAVVAEYDKPDADAPNYGAQDLRTDTEREADEQAQAARDDGA